MKELEDFSEAADNVATKRTNLGFASSDLSSAESTLLSKASAAKSAIDSAVSNNLASNKSVRQFVAPTPEIPAATEAVGLVPVAIEQGGLTPAPVGASDPSAQTATL